MDRPKAAKVRIVYPKPGVAPAMVAPSALEHWRSRGWMTEEEHAEWLKARDEAENPAAPADPPGEAAEPDTASPGAESSGAESSDSESPAGTPAAGRSARKRRTPKEHE